MPLSMTEIPEELDDNLRIRQLKRTVQETPPAVCTERARIWTRYHRNPANRRKPAAIQMAEALREVLLQKRLSINPNELIVGNFSSKRVGGSLYPELHGIPMLEALFRFSHRPTNPLQITRKEQWALLKIIPFWARRFLAYRSYSSAYKRWRFILHQLQGRFYLINESGGISHLAPDYEMLLRLGTDTIVDRITARQDTLEEDSERYIFYAAVKIIADGLALFGERYAQRAAQMAAREKNADRQETLNGKQYMVMFCGFYSFRSSATPVVTVRPPDVENAPIDRTGAAAAGPNTLAV